MMLIRCNASPQVGFGHLTRCRVLAEHARQRGIASIVVGPATGYAEAADATLFADWIERPDWWSSQIEAAFLIALARRHNARLAVIDDYRSDGEHQRLLHDAGLRVLQQYNSSAPPLFAAQLVVNASPGESADLHPGRCLHGDVRFLHGPRYAILRDSFLALAPVPRQGPVRRIFVSFGGGDDRGAVDFVLRSLADDLPAGTDLIVMSGGANPRNDAIAARVAALDNPAISLEISPGNVAGLMLSCDLAVMSGGTTTFETARCGLPMILLPVAENQYAQCQGWQALGAARYLGPFKTVSETQLSEATADLMMDEKMRNEMSAAGAAAVDGVGCQRLVSALLERS